MKDAFALRHRCHQRWRDLTPNGRGRHCAECDTTVVDLSRLTRKEALRRVAGGACVRILRDASGAPLFRAEPPKKAGLVVATALLGGCAVGPAPSSSPSRGEAPAVVAAPPLAPVSPIPGGLAVADLADLSELEGALRQWRYEDGPTPEQIALTEAKHRPPFAASALPPSFLPGGGPTHGAHPPSVILLEELGVPFD